MHAHLGGIGLLGGQGFGFIEVRLDLHHKLGNRLIHDVHERLGVESDPYGHDDQGREVGDLTEVQVLHLGVHFGDGSEHHALEHPQHVGGAQDDAGGGHHGHPWPGLEGAHEDRRFTDEAIQQGQSDTAHGHEHEDGRVDGHGLRKSTVVRDHAGVAAFVDDAHRKE